jgi:hypothetical protein
MYNQKFGFHKSTIEWLSNSYVSSMRQQHTRYLILENEEEKMFGNLEDDKEFH